MCWPRPASPQFPPPGRSCSSPAGVALTIDQLELFAPPVFFLLAPPIAGAAPWVAGELLSGPSRRQEGSLAAALASAYLAAALAFGVALPAGLAVALTSAGASATVLAAAAYLGARGPAA